MKKSSKDFLNIIFLSE